MPSSLSVPKYCWCPFAHVTIARVLSLHLGAEVGRCFLRHPFVLTFLSRALSTAGHTVLIYDYFLTFHDEVSPLLYMHSVENIALVLGLVHLECPLDNRESHVPPQPIRKPCWADCHSLGREWHPRTRFPISMLQFHE